jgi:GH15 family glucan-1,4-alpha-glucosidase
MTYPPISDYAYIGDCHSSALISRSCSIDWCCMPRVDSPSCFGRLLDWERGGYSKIIPKERCEISRRYVEDTLVLETIFQSPGREVRVRDCFTMREGGEHHPHRQVLRMIEGVKGEMELMVEVMPRFDYGAVKPWVRSYRKDHFIALGGSHGLLICGDLPLHMNYRHDLAGSCIIAEGQRLHLSFLYRRPEDLDEGAVDVPDIPELDRRMEETLAWWKTWSSRSQVKGPYANEVRRSAVVLKGLSNAPSGAIAAAPTTSLPEAVGGARNWDYRFSWIRDSAFTVRSLASLGHVREADGFRRFVERSAAGSAEEVQIVFGVGGERRLQEFEMPSLEGYQGSKPVRVGNAAEGQMQLDVYGEILDLAWTWYRRGHEPDEDYWDFLVDVLNATVNSWHLPDQGIWEMRGRPRHFVQSKAMCWSALDRGVRMAEELGQEAPVEKWKKARDQIRQAIEEKGYDHERGVFIQAFDFPRMDSALLLLPVTGFLQYKDERMIRTTDAIREELEEHGFLRRYAADGDDLGGREGTFLACTFWLVECLAYQGRRKEARQIFQKALSAGNDLFLFSEEYDPREGKMLGNFPQGLTHLSLIAAAMALDEEICYGTARFWNRNDE